jgi:hypothetical protein
MTHDARPGSETRVRSTAEALRAISDELRALERLSERQGDVVPPPAPRWALAVTAFAAGVALSLAARAAGIGNGRR